MTRPVEEALIAQIKDEYNARCKQTGEFSIEDIMTMLGNDNRTAVRSFADAQVRSGKWAKRKGVFDNGRLCTMYRLPKIVPISRKPKKR